MQKKLLWSLFGNDYQIDNIDNGRQQLMSCFRSFSHGILILDDVDHLDQLDALFLGADKYTFPSNCLILIMSRNKCVLGRSGIQPESIYPLSGLNTHHSRELFCCHDFCQPHSLPCFLLEFSGKFQNKIMNREQCSVYAQGSQKKIVCWRTEFHHTHKRFLFINKTADTKGSSSLRGITTIGCFKCSTKTKEMYSVFS